MANLDYSNPGDEEYAAFQMLLHKALCARARGEVALIPCKATPEHKNCAMIQAQCKYCNADVEVTDNWYKQAIRKNGGVCCNDCRIELSAIGHRGKKHNAK